MFLLKLIIYFIWSRSWNKWLNFL